MQLKIWGCRGSIATPGPTTVVCGGNTSCVEISLDDGSVLVLDAGTGVRDLGDELVARGVDRVHLLLTHLHLDHVEGLRFFAPLWRPNSSVEIWGPPSPVSALEERIARLFSPPLFPRDLRDVPSKVTFHDVPRQPWSIGSARITAALVSHPGPTLGYRIEGDGSSVAYLPDHEPALTGIDDRPTEWLSGGTVARDADVLLHDAQYFDEEYGSRIGWGHSSVSDAVAYAQAVGARRIVLFHHEPEHSDDELFTLEDRAKSSGPQAELARDGMVVELP